MYNESIALAEMRLCRMAGKACQGSRERLTERFRRFQRLVEHCLLQNGTDRAGRRVSFECLREGA